MKEKIICQDLLSLKILIKEEVQKNGTHCDLNHIDVSQMTDLRELFKGSDFNGDISRWDVSQVVNMSNLFDESKFTGDISQWNTSKVMFMLEMFKDSQFNGDISKWNVSKVVDFRFMFYRAEFNQDVSQWNVKNAESLACMFLWAKNFKQDLTTWKPYVAQLNEMLEGTKTSNPYWNIANLKERKKAILAYEDSFETEYGVRFKT